MSVTIPSQSPTQGNFIKTVYSDVNSQYTQDTQSLILTNMAAVNGEIVNLIMTQIGSRPFEPEFGSAVPDLLFDQPSNLTIWVMKNKLFEAINRWMPNVQFDYQNSTIQPLVYESGFYFRLVYSVYGIDIANIQLDLHITM